MNVLEIVLGGLLHDIGELMRRAHEPDRVLNGHGPRKEDAARAVDSKGAADPPSSYTKKFIEGLSFLPEGVNKTVVSDLAGYRLDPEAGEIIAEADRLSAGMVREDESAGRDGTEEFRKIRLRSVAGAMMAGDIKRDKIPVFEPAPLSPQRAFPRLDFDEENLSGDYAGLWEQFKLEWDKNQCRDPLGFINRADSILEKYTWCIPSAASALRDTALYDHLKTTAAISACLFEAGPDNEKPFLMTAGDLTGIQNYIFDIRQGAGGLARRLRARSFNVSVYTAMVSFHILTELGLPLTQQVLFAGGKFHLVLPNTKPTRQRLAAVRQSVSQWLFERSYGEVGLALAFFECGGKDLRTYSAAISGLQAALRDERDRMGRERFIRDGSWAESEFLFPPMDIPLNGGLCASCHKQGGPLRSVREKEEPVCDGCQADANRGRMLPKSKYLAFYSDDSGNHPGPVGSYSLLADILECRGQSGLTIDMDVPAGAIDAKMDDRPIVGKMWGKYVPRDRLGDVVPFDELANRAEGRPALAYLKMDVDNMGWIFSEGLKGPEPGRDCISRASTLSRTLELFFGGYLEELLAGEFHDVYLVYSGGDDVLAVGPWNVMFDLAARIREEFRRYTGGNPIWTLSAGLVLATPHTPVLIAVDEAERCLEWAKSGAGFEVLSRPAADEKPDPAAPDKNRLAAFGTSIPWEKYPSILARAKKVLGWLEDGAINTGKVHRLLSYADMHQAFQRTRDTRYFRYAPALVYDLKRNWGEKTAGEHEAKEWAAALVGPESEEMKTLRFVCEYALSGFRGHTVVDAKES